MRARLRDTSGQMTIELAVVFPVVIIVAVIAVNALQFFGLCAAFDRMAHQEIRVCAASPAYGSDPSRCCAQIQQSLQSALSEKGAASISVTYANMGVDLQEFKAQVEYLPSLFGLGLKSEVFGIRLPRLTHATHLVVDCYRPGVFV